MSEPISRSTLVEVPLGNLVDMAQAAGYSLHTDIITEFEGGPDDATIGIGIAGDEPDDFAGLVCTVKVDSLAIREGKLHDGLRQAMQHHEETHGDNGCAWCTGPLHDHDDDCVGERLRGLL